MAKLDTNFNFGANARPKKKGKGKKGAAKKKAGKRSNAWQSYTGGK
jgi:hypothetical protein